MSKKVAFKNLKLNIKDLLPVDEMQSTVGGGKL